MNKLFNLSVIPMAATIASLALSSAPAQALSLTGELDLTGGYTFNDQGALGGNDDTLSFDTSQIVNTSTGDFAQWFANGVKVAVSPLTLADVASNSLGTTLLPSEQAYDASANNPFITFDNGVTFTANNPFDAFAVKIDDSYNFVLGSFSGTFKDVSGKVIARGSFSANNLFANSYSLSVTPVPEPLTILGTGLALGFGGLFKSKKSKKQLTEV